MMCENNRFYHEKGVLAQRYTLPGRRHGGGLDEDYNRDYGLAPPNLQRRAYMLKSRKEEKQLSDSRNPKIAKPPTLERQRVRNNNPEGNKFNKQASKQIEVKQFINAIPYKVKNEKYLSHREHSMFKEDTTGTTDQEHVSDDTGWDVQEILPVAPNKSTEAILKLTHGANPRNNPRNRISIDNFSPERPIRKSSVLLYKRRQPEAPDYDDFDNLKAVTVLSKGSIDQLSKRHVGFNLGGQSVTMVGYNDDRERLVPRIVQRSKTLHETGMDKLKPILKTNMGIPGPSTNQIGYYDRFARHSRQGGGDVKLPPISAPPSNTSSPRRQRRKLRRETSMKMNCSEEFAYVVKELGN